MSQQQDPQENKIHSFNTILGHIRKDLTKSEVILSKVIHNRVAEIADEILTNTIFKPSGIIGASSVTLIGLVLLAYMSNTIGFCISGSETLALAVVGYVFGIFCEWLLKCLSLIIDR